MGNFTCTKRLLILPTEVNNNVSDARRYDGCAKFFFSDMQKYFKLEQTLKIIQDTIGDVHCPGKCCLGQSCVHVHTWKGKGESCYECLQFKS